MRTREKYTFQNHSFIPNEHIHRDVHSCRIPFIVPCLGMCKKVIPVNFNSLLVFCCLRISSLHISGSSAFCLVCFFFIHNASLCLSISFFPALFVSLFVSYDSFLLRSYIALFIGAEMYVCALNVCIRKNKNMKMITSMAG